MLRGSSRITTVIISSGTDLHVISSFVPSPAAPPGCMIDRMQVSLSFRKHSPRSATNSTSTSDIYVPSGDAAPCHLKATITTRCSEEMGCAAVAGTYLCHFLSDMRRGFRSQPLRASWRTRLTAARGYLVSSTPHHHHHSAAAAATKQRYSELYSTYER